MRIIGTWSSPFTRKVRIVALERGIPVDFLVDSPLSDDTLVSKVNPLTKVPVLIRDDDSPLIASSLIAQFLDECGTGPSLVDGNGLKRIDVLQWEAIADGVLDAAVLTRMECLRPENERSDAWTRRQRAKIEGGLSWFDRQLGKDAYCTGGRFSLSDIAMGCCIGYLCFRFPDDAWYERYPNIARASKRLEQRQSFQSTRFQS
jgi:glutathione S-transferase